MPRASRALVCGIATGSNGWTAMPPGTGARFAWADVALGRVGRFMMFIHFLERPGVGPLRVRMVLAERYVRKGRAMHCAQIRHLMAHRCA